MIEPLSPRPVFQYLQSLALLLICGPFLQGGLMKLLDFQGARAEMTHFGLAPPGLFAVGVTGLELIASGTILSGRLRCLGALVLAAFTAGATGMAYRFWELEGPARFAATNGFFEHGAIVGALLLIAWHDLRIRG